MKSIYTSFFLLISLATAFSQVQLNYTKVNSTAEEANKISESVNKYELLTLDFDKLNSHVKTNKSAATFKITLSDKLSWDLVLEENEIRYGSFKSVIINRDGSEQSIPIGECNTYSGYVNGDKDQYVRLFISKDMIKGMIVDKEKGLIIIEPLSSFTNSDQDNRLVVYNLADTKFDRKVCGVDNATLKSATNISDTAPVFTNCRILELITEADGEYWAAHGGNASSVSNNMLANINVVNGVYMNTFNIRVVVVKQFLNSNPATDPYTLTDGGNDFDGGNQGIVREFGDFWNSNRSSEKRDAAILFTGKNVTGYLGRVSQIGTMCRDLSKSYAFTNNHPINTYIVAHELGHLFGAVHPNASDCAPNQSVMCTGTAPVANLFFANSSQNLINNHLNAGESCLRFFSSIGIFGDAELCVNSTATYQALDGVNNNWSWTSSSNISLNSTSGQTITATGNADGSGWIEATQNLGCPVTKRFNIQVGKPVANVLLNGSDIHDDFCTGDVVNIEVTSVLPQIDAGSWSYNWSFAYGNTSGNFNPSSAQWASYSNDHPECTGIDIDITNVCGTVRQRAVICTRSCFPWFKVYPNPATDRVSVEFESIDNVEALPGRLILYSEKSTTPIETVLIAEAHAQSRFEDRKINFNVKNLPRGIYYLHVVYDKKEIEHKTEKIRILLD